MLPIFQNDLRFIWLCLAGLIVFSQATPAVGQDVEFRRNKSGIRQATPSNIPSPRPEGWVVDETGVLKREEFEHINQVCEEVFQKLGREMTVVVIDTTAGAKPRVFATQLFNNWGVGGAFRNNGVLLFAAIKDRRAEIVLGEGVDTGEQKRISRQIMDSVVVPNFQDGDPASALYEGIRSCATQILSVSELEAPTELPGAALRRDQVKRYKRRRSLLPWILGGLGLGGLGLVVGGRYWLRYRPRDCNHCREDRILLDEAKDDEFLEPPELLEEQLGSADYDVWACLTCEDVEKIRYGKFWSRFSTCPKCEYATRCKISRTLVQATTMHGGKVLVEESCRHCDYYDRHVYRTPMVRTQSSSSGRGRGGFGGGSMGGGGGSGFGGGSSSGGGASGSW